MEDTSTSAVGGGQCGTDTGQTWPGEVDDHDELPPLPLSPPAPATLADLVEEYRSILNAIDYQDTTDLSKPLAYRAHLERLVESFWDAQVHHALAFPGAPLADEQCSKLREMIQHHPFSRLSPLLLRWPLLAADVPRPAWTLGEEVVAIMERQRREMLGRVGGTDLRKCEEPMDGEPALATVITCQHALVGLLSDLSSQCVSQRAPTRTRDAIVGWRQILATISSRPNVPDAVFQATQDRLHSIYGQVDFAPPFSWMSAMGMGGTDNVFETLRSDKGMPAKWQRVSRVTSPRRGTTKNLNSELLLPTTHKRARYLEPHPKGRQVRSGRKRKAGLK